LQNHAVARFGLHQCAQARHQAFDLRRLPHTLDIHLLRAFGDYEAFRAAGLPAWRTGYAFVRVNGPVVFPFVGFPNATSGTFMTTWAGLSPANRSDLFAGNLYTNIHNANFSAGEIRGQILPVPELPASALALIPAVAALTGLVRRRLRGQRGL
jgi:hypothetical protein